MKLPTVAAIASVLFVTSWTITSSTANSNEPESATHFQDVIRPVLVKFCGDCHASGGKSESIDLLGSTTADQIAEDRSIWASAAEQLRNRTMPPADENQPSEHERLEIAAWIESHLKRTACNQGDYAGNPVPRRLNRDQYTYAIEDLTGVPFDFVETFPADGSGGEGFDNNGETLFLPPLLMERYLEVAQQVVDHVILTDPLDVTYVAESTKTKNRFRLVPVAELKSQQEARLTPGSSASFVLPIYADDDFGLTLKATHSSDEPATVIVKIDGIVVKRIMIPSGDDSAVGRMQIRFSRGPHRIELRIPNRGTPVTFQSLRLDQPSGDKNARRRRQQTTDRIFGSAAEMISDNHRNAAKKVTGSFARLAWRRPVTDDEIDRLLDLYDRGAERDEPFRQAIKLPLKAILVSPHFLFIVEGTHEAPGVHRISDLELATRLSFFLWHSLPDETLIRLAEKNELRQQEELRKQVRRMLADDRSYRFAEAFAGQWLGTVAVGNTVIPDTNFFKPAYNSELVIDLRRQVGETMHHMLRQNEPVTDWLDADYVIVNHRLAKHYGLEPVPHSDEFERVSVGDAPRAGVIGLGAVHMLTSYSKRTSPVLRGGWVLETIFGTRIPAPPADIPNLEGGEKEVEAKTVRQRLQNHRENPTCAACHDLIDPIGFAMENFDVLGRWRDKEGKNKIDARGELPSGETFDGPSELRRVLMAKKDEFIHQICQRMLGFALARSLEDADQCTVSQLAERLKQDHDRIESLVMGIVQSVPFQNRQGVSRSAKP